MTTSLNTSTPSKHTLRSRRHCRRRSSEIGFLVNPQSPSTDVQQPRNFMGERRRSRRRDREKKEEKRHWKRRGKEKENCPKIAQGTGRIWVKPEPDTCEPLNPTTQHNMCHSCRRPIKFDVPCVIHADTTLLQTYPFGPLNPATQHDCPFRSLRRVASRRQHMLRMQPKALRPSKPTAQHAFPRGPASRPAPEDTTWSLCLDSERQPTRASSPTTTNVAHADASFSLV